MSTVDFGGDKIRSIELIEEQQSIVNTELNRRAADVCWPSALLLLRFGWLDKPRLYVCLLS